MIMKPRPVMVLLFWSLASTIGNAADFDGSKALICTATEVKDCAFFDGCQRASPQSVNLPRFLRIDFDNKEIKGEGRATAIQNLSEAEGLVIMQGIQGDRAWSLSLSTTTGDITGTVAGDGYGFLVFGVCATLESLGS